MTSGPDQTLPPIGWLQKYRLRLKRKRLLWHSVRSRHDLTCLSDRTRLIAPGAILAFTTVRNEITRLPWFFRHYRALGVDHFLMVDNGSDDGTAEYLADQPDVSLWQTDASYRASRYGVHWLTWLQMRYGHGHWTLTVDADELLVYAHHDTASLRDLTAWLQDQGQDAFGALMLDLYPKGPLGTQTYEPDTDPTQILNWFDSGPYRSQRQAPLGNLWVQGGARERAFFADTPRKSPTLNKIPLVRWSRRYVYVISCHSALPRHLNAAYDGPSGATPSGVLLHTKFLPEIIGKSKIEKDRKQHFHDPDQFTDYYDHVASGPDLWTPQSERYTGWADLERLGLMTAGGWTGKTLPGKTLKS
ncbi:glycosyltransferase family 2 protein [Ruegeria sp.]|uniref:glycosyltransferase family 2 protein n=1 Tax=Ruegeria sp. TaxID=1879320 RepID=UPI00231A8179|nr:glycosyltransferase family 2 protein [Ruegeria sp.]MDA7963735.1 glycosyltransferase family 2 protein [Ruegeria sp.]